MVIGKTDQVVSCTINDIPLRSYSWWSY